MDDDVEYKLDCLDRYVSTILKGHIHHMSYCQMNPIVHPKSTWEKRGYVVKNINQMTEERIKKEVLYDLWLDNKLFTEEQEEVIETEIQNRLQEKNNE